MLDPKAIDEALTHYVRPQTFPVAVRMARSLDEIPAKARRPKRDLGVQVAVCQTIGMARRYGWTLGLTVEDLSCPLAMVAFGFAPEPAYYSGGALCAALYTATPEAGARTEALVPRLGYAPTRALIVGPLARATYQPDVVVVYGNSAQVMRLVQGAIFQTGGGLTSTSIGRIDCAEAVIRTLRTDECQFVLPCTGDRMFGLTADDEMIFAMPAGKVETVLEGLKATHEAGIRYPIPVFLRFQAQYPPRYHELYEDLVKGLPDDG